MYASLVSMMCACVCACVGVCPVRQFNVQLSVEKVFIAQKTSEDRVWKGKAAGKDTELVGYGKGTGEGLERC